MSRCGSGQQARTPRPSRVYDAPRHHPNVGALRAREGNGASGLTPGSHHPNELRSLALFFMEASWFSRNYINTESTDRALSPLAHRGSARAVPFALCSWSCAPLAPLALRSRSSRSARARRARRAPRAPLALRSAPLVLALRSRSAPPQSARRCGPSPRSAPYYVQTSLWRGRRARRGRRRCCCQPPWATARRRIARRPSCSVSNLPRERRSGAAQTTLPGSRPSF